MNKALNLILSTLIAIISFVALPAAAHEIRPAIADVEIGENSVTLTVDVALEPLVADLDLGAIFDTNESPNADEHDALRALPPEELESRFREQWPRLREGITIASGGTELVLELRDVSAGPVGDVEIARDGLFTIEAALPPGSAPVIIGWQDSYGSLVLRQVSDTPEDAFTFYLTDGQLSDPIPRSGAAAQPWFSAFADYVRIGFEHIVPKGLDHILFVLGLFFFSLKMRPLLWQVSAFTLAHTVTLALASLGIVNLPASIVEPLIAASIVFVAVENVLQREFRQSRTAVVFAFGLLHGLGFASVLGDIGLDPARFITGLVAFNIGVELGQLAVIAVAFLAVGIWAGQKSWYRPVIAVPASVAIAIVGAYWFLERTVL